MESLEEEVWLVLDQGPSNSLDDGGADDRLVDLERHQCPAYPLIEEAPKAKLATRAHLDLYVSDPAGEADADRLESGLFAGPEAEDGPVFLVVRERGECGEFPIGADALCESVAAGEFAQDLEIDTDLIGGQGDNDELARVGGVEKWGPPAETRFAILTVVEDDFSWIDARGPAEDSSQNTAGNDESGAPFGDPVAIGTTTLLFGEVFQ